MKAGEKVFVYGTLRPGHGANYMLDGKAKHVGPTRISATMYNLGWFPGIKVSGDGQFISEGPTVVGDVYEIEGDDLSSRLDSYEGYPTLYDRKQVTAENGETVWVYEINQQPNGDSLMPTGNWNDFVREEQLRN